MPLGTTSANTAPGLETQSCGGGGGGCGGGSGACGMGRIGCLPTPLSPNPVGPGVICCVAGELMISMADGSQKAACLVSVGDVLNGVDSQGNPREQVVTAVLAAEQASLEIRHDEGSFICSESHILLTFEGDEVYADKVVPGTRLMAVGNSCTGVLSVSSLGQGKVYGWTCEPDHTFIAEGVVHHNKVISVDTTSY